MPISKNYFAIPTIVVLTLFSVNAHAADCPQDPTSILQPGGIISVTGEPGISYDDVLENRSVHDSDRRASTFRDRYDGNSVVRYSSDISINDQEMSKKPKGNFESSAMGCVEEVLVTAQKISTSKGIWWFIGGAGFVNWLKNKVGSGGDDEPGDPLAKAPKNPGNIGSDTNCQSDEIARRTYANRDIFSYLQAFSPIGRIQLADTQVWVEYNNGDSELWTIVDSSGMNNGATGSEPPIVCKPKP